MGYYGEDGQMYDTLDQLRGANNRYRQQQEQNRLLKEQNDLMQKENERKIQEEKDKQREREQKEFKERIDYFVNHFYLFSKYNDYDNFGKIKEAITREINYIEEYLQNDIDILVKQRKEINNMQKENSTEFERAFNKSSEDLFEDNRDEFLLEFYLLKSFINKRKDKGIDFCTNLFEYACSNIINYANLELGKLNYIINFEIKMNNMKPKYSIEFEIKDETLSDYLKIEDEILKQKKENQTKVIENLKNKNEQIDKKIKEVNNKINQLNKSTTLKNIDEVKNIITDVDYDFLKEIIGNNYSLEEIVLLIKGHIKQVELEVPKLENKKNYYKVLMYLTENVTYTDIFDYAEFDENTDYKKEYDRILKFENDKKEEDKKLEQQRKIQEEKNKKLEEERKIKEKKIQEDKRNEERAKKILPLYKKRNSYKKTMIGLNIFLALIGILFTVMSIMESPALLVTVGMLIVMAIFFNIIFKPEKQYLSQIKLLNLGFKSIEEFEKEAVKIIENNKNN